MWANWSRKQAALVSGQSLILITDLDKEDGTMVRIDSRRPRMVCLAVWFISGLQEPTLCLVHSQSSINTVG